LIIVRYYPRKGDPAKKFDVNGYSNEWDAEMELPPLRFSLEKNLYRRYWKDPNARNGLMNILLLYINIILEHIYEIWAL
jgi:hypothetical protein